MCFTGCCATGLTFASRSVCCFNNQYLQNQKICLAIFSTLFILIVIATITLLSLFLSNSIPGLVALFPNMTLLTQCWVAGLMILISLVSLWLAITCFKSRQQVSKIQKDETR